MTAAAWDPVNSPVEYVELGGHRTPGIAKLTGWSRIFHWDERRGYGFTGATAWYKGEGLARGKLEIRLLTADDWAAWNTFQKVLEPPRDSAGTRRVAVGQNPDGSYVYQTEQVPTSPFGPRPHALAIHHPITAGLGVNKVVVGKVHQPEQDEQGGWTVQVELVQFREPTFHLSKPEVTQERPAADGNDQAIGNLIQVVHNHGQGDLLQALAPSQLFGHF